MGDTFGGGVMVAIAAVLWVAYLLPSWLNRRQYLATERNALRLQQTLRLLAETAETPDEVRVSATARSAAAQEKILRQRTATEKAKLRMEAKLVEAELATAERAAELAEKAVHDARDGGAARRRRLRQVRASVSLTMLAAVAGGIVSIASGAWLLTAVATFVAAAAVLSLGALARAGGRLASPVSVETVRPAAAPTFEPIEWAEPAAPEVQRWTPRALPKPMHLSRGSVSAAAMDSVEAGEKLRRAAVFAAMSERAAAMNAQPVPIRTAPSAMPPAPAASTPEDARYARMGIVDEAQLGISDLDAVLRRRRAS